MASSLSRPLPPAFPDFLRSHRVVQRIPVPFSSPPRVFPQKMCSQMFSQPQVFSNNMCSQIFFATTCFSKKMSKPLTLLFKESVQAAAPRIGVGSHRSDSEVPAVELCELLGLRGPKLQSALEALRKLPRQERRNERERAARGFLLFCATEGARAAEGGGVKRWGAWVVFVQV